MPMYDFETTLRKWLKQIQPKRILEYGPGFSTNIMLQECPNSNITSIEHQLKWYKKAKKRFKNKAQMVYMQANNIKSHYACWPLMQGTTLKYDLIFIDGRRRVECLVAGLEVLNANGVIILHDAYRKEYQHGIALYDIIEDNGHTKVLKKKIKSKINIVDINLKKVEPKKSENDVNELKIIDNPNISESKVLTTFITAAYGSKYHRYVRGLARSFAKSNNSDLIIFTDSKDMNLPGTITDNSLTFQTLKEYSRGLPINSSKPLILLHAAQKYKNICWIDADMLVFTNLSSKFDTNYLNTISYGFGNNKRECGANLQVIQNRYCMSGLFSCSQKYIFEYEKIWHELKAAIAMKAKLFDQSLLNHLVARNKDSVKYLNLEFPNMIWNFEKYRSHKRRGSCHPLPTNKKFCRGLNVKNGTLHHNSIPIAVHCWTSISLERHLRSNFRFISNMEARNYLMNLYK